ncbi:STE20-related kinase adapter protein alpha isoform X2 [Denticeps clupeoides]|nr:STE20-related kinase adapter protein alpha isoform X2 [Denticeps clupeoides]XP_028843545.1 STE20-related kinase adapter protein alpha isoform X2 [Denticeps clupeoides]XP_028843546.1 STE20-related kinase adapter protein alpha isoform X2 [Denticeps clupeoides]
MSFLRWVSEKLSVESLRDLELFGEQAQASPHRNVHEDSEESLSSAPRQDTMCSFLPDSTSYELLTIVGRGLEDLMTVNLARYRPTGELVAIRRIDLESCTNDMVTYLQGELHVSKLFHHPSILPYKSVFIAENELWVITPFMAYGSARDLISSHFTEGMSELSIAYILLGVLRGLEYVHHMGYVHRSVKASHVLISADGQVCLSGLRSIFSLIRHGQRARVVHDFPQYSVRVLPWLSPEVLQQNLQGYDFRSDIYSLGITACELANGHVPFKDMAATQMLLEKLNGTVPCLLDTTTIPPEDLSMKPSRSGADSGICEGPGTSSGSHPYNRTFSPQFHAFVELCLQRDPEKRPSASALSAHPFFKQIKRRPSEALPELLRPLSPITSFESVQLRDSPAGLASLESGLSQLDVDDWDF